MSIQKMEPVSDNFARKKMLFLLTVSDLLIQSKPNPKIPPL